MCSYWTFLIGSSGFPHSITIVIFRSCDYVAIGNGVGCRDAETFISQLIKQRVFAPLEIAYW